MREVFQGWRRKAGLVMLAMACVLTAPWMRSAVFEDRITIATFPQAVHILVSERGRFSWWHMETPTRRTDGSYYLAMPSSWESRNYSSDVGWRQDLEPGDEICFVVVPYWSLVLPLTLLSAWLILGKTRKSTGGTP